MPDYYFQTLGEAWSAIAAAFTGGGTLTYLASGFSVAWVTSAGSDGGHFEVAGSVVGGSNYAEGNYYARNVKTAAGLQLSAIIRAPGFSDSIQVTSGTFPGALTISGLNTQLQAARQDAIEDATGATMGTAATQTLTRTGASVALVTANMSPWVNAGEVTIDVTTIADNRGQSTKAQVNAPFQPIWPTSQAAQVVNVINTSPRLDFNMAINDGEAIFTGTSNTFTGP
jgi:hypothetical protein